MTENKKFQRWEFVPQQEDYFGLDGTIPAHMKISDWGDYIKTKEVFNRINEYKQKLSEVCAEKDALQAEIEKLKKNLQEVSIENDWNKKLIDTLLNK